ncbi:excinuclease ABC subunit C [Nitrosopumilus sp. b1]|uniref:excinuclease ABC subunit UvrC n=1 Tax=Nitrosopumilus sp. b1 TaxID=2109907 RepID=UPI0015F3DDEA|nr:excinuclease ABC subunit UvrC [Nitrosopumilus sp. b1]KAF6244088.1 excinuclease ABC subunit C [Nitrosopumilus sp. b1]
MSFNIKNITIPAHPGIYLMKDNTGKIIYIGKAKNLKNRVRSYFLKNQNYKTQKLVEKISDIEFVLTDNESEAFLLESNMIKKYRPMYNIELKDQQRYTYLRLTEERFPRLLVARRMRTGKFLGGGKIFGPFTQGSSKLLTIGSLRKTFKIRICKTLPKKACLEYHLGNCEAPCEFKTAQENYSKNILELESILKGKKEMQEFVSKLKQEMQEASNSLQFERAKEIRDTLHRLGSLNTNQKMEYVENAPDEDYFGIMIEEHTAHIMTLKQKQGVIRDRERFSFDLVADNTFSNFLFQYYTTHKIPKFVIVNSIPENVKILESLLSKHAGFSVKILAPKLGKRKRMIDLIMKNIRLIQTTGAEPGLVELRDILGLKETPRVIECFDISNHGADYAVASMSRFVEGTPDKSGYRKFRIKTVTGRDDYAMIGEVIKRRYLRLAEEKIKFPDLILVDGGKGQLRAAMDSLASLAVNIPCVSLAKKNEEVFVPKKKESIIIPKEEQALKILQHARDEAHRFGVSYNRNLRKIETKKKKGKNL